MSEYTGKVPSRKGTLADRLAFYARPNPETGCVLWCGHRNQGGYGRLMFRRRTTTAHRWAWEVANGPVPDGMQVLHKCDIRHCVNPNHLFLGTNADNVADKTVKGRAMKGRPMGKRLSADVVRKIRALPFLTNEICERFGRTDGQMRNIRNRRVWKNVE